MHYLLQNQVPCAIAMTTLLPHPGAGCLKKIGAGNEIRTRDPDLGKVVLYQLSYSRFRRPVLSSVWSAISNRNSGFTRKADPPKTGAYSNG